MNLSPTQYCTYQNKNSLFTSKYQKSNRNSNNLPKAAAVCQSLLISYEREENETILKLHLKTSQLN